jgi:glycosyltransferase involved in cell wall biosynthesis
VAENDRLRCEAVRTQVTLRHTEAQYAGLVRDLSAIRASRAWRAAQWLRGLLRGPTKRRASGPVRGAAPVASAWVGEADAAPPTIVLIVPAHAGAAAADTPDVLEPGFAGARCDVVRMEPADAGSAVARCNAAADAARADFVVLWDGASRPQPGWLGALADSFGRFEGAGMAGALLLAADGRIAAAGAAILPDGRLAPLGAGEHPGDPAYASVRPVEALPLGAVMVPTSLWRRFGGLDESLGSPTSALADLALRLRAAGWSAVCQPFARLSARAPQAHDPGWVEAFGRWRLRQRRTAGGNGLAAIGLAAVPPPRALFVDNLVPTPDRDAASIDMVLYLRSFVAFGYETTLLPAGDLARRGADVDNLRRDGVRVVAEGWAESVAGFLARERTPFEVILLYRVSLAAGGLLEALKAHSPQARIVYNTVDLHFLRMEREAMLLRSVEKLDEAFRVQQIELATIARADCSILLSPVEQPLIADLLPRARTCVVPIARAVRGRTVSFGPRHGVRFVGSFRHQPNVDAMLTFVRETWPLVRRRLATTLDIVGADPPDEVRALADPASGIAVLGHVEDLDALLDRTRLTVAPLRFGAGTKGKIVTSLAAGVPCVASPIAAEGMGLTDRVHVRVAATPEAFADAVVEVHEQEPIWTAMSDAGLAFAAQAFSVAEVRQRLAKMLRDLGLPAGETNRPSVP